MVGSINMFGRDIKFEVKVGDRKVLVITVKDQSGNTVDLSDVTVYATAQWKVWQPDGTLLINGVATFSDRVNGQISYQLAAGDTVLANAGNWTGEVEMFNNGAVSSDQTESFNFNILESF